MGNERAGFKVAVIGAGKMARQHIRAFTDVPGVTVAGIHSLTRWRAEGLASEYAVRGVYDSIVELYERTLADLVVVATPPETMNAVGRACFEFPWTVLLETPPGLGVRDGEEIYAAAGAKNRKALVALNRRFMSSTRVALADIGQHEGPRFIKVQDQEDQAGVKSSTITYSQFSTRGHSQVEVDNWMYANSIHLIDYFLLFGRGKVTGVKPVVAWDPHDPWVVVSKIEFDSGDIGVYEGIWNGPGPWAVSVSTAEKGWEMRPLEQLAVQLRGERCWHPVEGHVWDRDFKPGLRLQAEMAVAAALGEPSELPTLDEAMKTMRLIHGIFGQ